MQLLVVRHAIAEDTLEWAAKGLADADRPLTATGRSLMKRNAAGLATLMPKLEIIATSPFARATATAELLAHACKDSAVVELGALRSGGSRDGVVEWLRARPEDSIAIVGHEPDLGRLVAWFLAGVDSNPLAMRKGGACRIDFADRPVCAGAVLRWFLPPSLLRRLEP